MCQLGTVMSLLQAHSCVINLRKCLWGQTVVENLGHVVSIKGVQMGSLQGVRLSQSMLADPYFSESGEGFMGSTDYYHRSIQGYGQKKKSATSP